MRRVEYSSKLSQALQTKQLKLSEVIEVNISRIDDFRIKVHDSDNRASCEMILHRQFVDIIAFTKHHTSGGLDLLANERAARMTCCRMMRSQSPVLLPTPFLVLDLSSSSSSSSSSSYPLQQMEIYLVSKIFQRLYQTFYDAMIHYNTNSQVAQSLLHFNSVTQAVLFVRVVSISPVFEHPMNQTSKYSVVLFSFAPPSSSPGLSAQQLIYMILRDEQVCLTTLFNIGDTLLLYRPYLEPNSNEILFGRRSEGNRDHSMGYQIVARCAQGLHEQENLLSIHLLYGAVTVISLIAKCNREHQHQNQHCNVVTTQQQQQQQQKSIDPVVDISKAIERNENLCDSSMSIFCLNSKALEVNMKKLSLFVRILGVDSDERILWVQVVDRKDEASSGKEENTIMRIYFSIEDIGLLGAVSAGDLVLVNEVCLTSLVPSNTIRSVPTTVQMIFERLNSLPIISVFNAHIITDRSEICPMDKKFRPLINLCRLASLLSSHSILKPSTKFPHSLTTDSAQVLVIANVTSFITLSAGSENCVGSKRLLQSPIDGSVIGNLILKDNEGTEIVAAITEFTINTSTNIQFSSVSARSKPFWLNDQRMCPFIFLISIFSSIDQSHNQNKIARNDNIIHVDGNSLVESETVQTNVDNVENVDFIECRSLTLRSKRYRIDAIGDWRVAN